MEDRKIEGAREREREREGERDREREREQVKRREGLGWAGKLLISQPSLAFNPR